MTSNILVLFILKKVLEMIFDQTRIYTSFLKLAAQMSYSEALKILGLTGNPTEEEIKKAYKVKALENHPDRGGDVAVMAQINVAKDVLMKSKANPSYSPRPSKKIYDVGPFYKDETKTPEFDDLRARYNVLKRESITGITKGRTQLHMVDPESGVETWYQMFVMVFAVKDEWVFYAEKYRDDAFEIIEKDGVTIEKKYLNYFYENQLFMLPISKDIRKDGMETVSNMCQVGWQDLSMPVPTKCTFDDAEMSWSEAFGEMFKETDTFGQVSKIFEIFIVKEYSTLGVTIPELFLTEYFDPKSFEHAMLERYIMDKCGTMWKDLNKKKVNILKHKFKNRDQNVPELLKLMKAATTNGAIKAAILKTILNFDKVSEKPSPKKK